jgi:CheY-like chemotaxis protein
MNHNSDPVREVRHWMLVDDDEIILALLQYLLSTVSTAETHCFHSAADALRAFEQAPHKYEAVFTDFNMPAMNGIQLCQRLHELAPELKIVLATGSIEITNAQALLHGFCASVTKPFTPDALRAAVETIRQTSSDRVPVWDLDAMEAA